MAAALLDEETLETLTFERSKNWANFLKSCEKLEDSDEVMELSDFEEIYAGEDDSGSFPQDEAIEYDVVDDIANTTINKTAAEITQMLCSSDDKQQQAEMAEILNQTMPVFEEHMRKWKAAGLDRILNTFDAEKIEEHVGGWLRRNNSAYADKNLLQKSPEPEQTTQPKRNNKQRTPLYADSSSEAESMHSVDTAQYIRASRKLSATAKCSTTIKTYRTVPRKRDELRAKYSCTDHDDDKLHWHHMQQLRHRRQQHLDEQMRRHQLSCRQSPIRHYSCSSSFRNESHYRRKQLRKRRDNSPLYNTSSSDDDCAAYMSHCGCDACNRRVLARTMCSCRTHRNHHKHLMTRSTSSSQSFECTRVMRNAHHVERNRHVLRRQMAIDVDLRPRRLENECSCCNSARLCSNVVHVANSSTEDWVVENDSSPIEWEQAPKMTKASSLPATSTSPETLPNTSQKKKLALKAAHTSLPIMSKGRSVIKKKKITKIPATCLQHIEEENLEFMPQLEPAGEAKPIAELKVLLQKPKAKDYAATAQQTFVDEGKSIVKPEVSTNKKNANDNTLGLQQKEQELEPKANSMLKVSKDNKSDATSGKELNSIPAAASSGEFNKSVKVLLTKLPAESKIRKIKKGVSKSVPTKLRGNTKAVIKHDKTIGSTSEDEFDESIRKSQQIKSNQTAINSKQLDNYKGGECSSGKELAKPEPKTKLAKKVKHNSSIDSETERAIKLSKKTYEAEQRAKRTKAKPAQSTLSPPLAEQSLFNNRSVACNSTALVNDTACERAICAKRGSKSRSASSKSTITKAMSNSEEMDCTVVTSTTGCETIVEADETQKPVDFRMTDKGILLYAPHDRGLGPSSSKFTLTEQSLSGIIGERRARKFLKYNGGNRSFDSRLSIYYRPTPKLAKALKSGKLSESPNSSNSSASDEDIFERFQRYGELYTVLEKPNVSN